MTTWRAWSTTKSLTSVGLGTKSGDQILEWDVQDGKWTAVVMNADATAPVSARVSLGGRFDILFGIALGMAIAGVILLGVGILLIVLGARRPPAVFTGGSAAP
jgi:hypothetical protein